MYSETKGGMMKNGKPVIEGLTARRDGTLFYLERGKKCSYSYTQAKKMEGLK